MKLSENILLSLLQKQLDEIYNKIQEDNLEAYVPLLSDFSIIIGEIFQTLLQHKVFEQHDAYGVDILSDWLTTDDKPQTINCPDCAKTIYKIRDTYICCTCGNYLQKK